MEYMHPSANSASGSSASAAFWYHDMALLRSGSVSHSPSSYILPMRYIAWAHPLSAAALSHLTALSRSLRMPFPMRYMKPTVFWASTSSFSAQTVYHLMASAWSFLADLRPLS